LRTSTLVVLAIFLFLALALRPARDARGRIIRSQVAVHHFQVLTGQPNGWPGHVVDHIVPLVSGGLDDPINMQWQTIEEAKAKDRVEQLPENVEEERAVVAERVECIMSINTE